MSHFLYSIQISLHRLKRMKNNIGKLVRSILYILSSEFIFYFGLVETFLKHFICDFLNDLFHRFQRLFHTERNDVSERLIDCIYLLGQSYTAKNKWDLEFIDNILLTGRKKGCHEIRTQMDLLDVINKKIDVIQVPSNLRTQTFYVTYPYVNTWRVIGFDIIRFRQCFR